MPEYAIWIIILALGFVTSFIGTPQVMNRMRKAGITGADVHKKDQPLIPEMGGIAVLIGLAASMIGASILLPEKARIFAAFTATTLIAGSIGAIDDLKTLSAKVKPLLTTLASLPILIMNTYSPRMVLPIIGQTRLTIVYPLMIPIAIAVSSNAVNMMDPFNGTMSGACSIITLVLLISAIILGRSDAAIMCVGLLGSLLAFYYFNRYPSKVFSGDVGSLSIGAALGAIAIIGQLEIIAVVAFMPQIMNAFYGLATIGRLFERREVSRPVVLLEDERLAASVNPKAPITMARLILARGPLSEREAIQVFMALSAISGVFALFTTYLMVVTS